MTFGVEIPTSELIIKRDGYLDAAKLIDHELDRRRRHPTIEQATDYVMKTHGAALAELAKV